MKYSVTVKPRARVDSVEVLGQAQLSVRVRQPAHEGRANEELLRLLSAYFGVPRSAVRILRGLSSRRKIVEVISP